MNTNKKSWFEVHIAVFSLWIDRIIRKIYSTEPIHHRIWPRFCRGYIHVRLADTQQRAPQTQQQNGLQKTYSDGDTLSPALDDLFCINSTVKCRNRRVDILHISRICQFAATPYFS